MQQLQFSSQQIQLFSSTMPFFKKLVSASVYVPIPCTPVHSSWPGTNAPGKQNSKSCWPGKDTHCARCWSYSQGKSSRSATALSQSTQLSLLTSQPRQCFRVFCTLLQAQSTLASHRCLPLWVDLLCFFVFVSNICSYCCGTQEQPWHQQEAKGKLGMPQRDFPWDVLLLSHCHGNSSRRCCCPHIIEWKMSLCLIQALAFCAQTAAATGGLHSPHLAVSISSAKLSPTKNARTTLKVFWGFLNLMKHLLSQEKSILAAGLEQTKGNDTHQSL